MSTGAVTVDEQDGRRLRRNRNRQAVIEAYVDLMHSGVLEPNRDDLATACGISRRSIYRYFPNDGALVSAVADHIIERFLPILAATQVGDGSLDDRIAAFVAGRLDAFDLTAPITRAARVVRASDEHVARAFQMIRDSARSHLAEQFAPELAHLTALEQEAKITALHLPFLFDGIEYANSMHGDREAVSNLLMEHMARHLTAD